MKIYIKKVFNCATLPKIISKGDWIDLKLAEDVKFTGPEVQSRKIKYLPLGIAMELPKGFEAYVLPRSSTPNKWNIEVANSQAIIDESYKGDKDEWKLITKAFKAIEIPKGTRICQFRIMPKMNAGILTKLKWLFSNSVKLIKVDNLNNNNRGGIGTTN